MVTVKLGVHGALVSGTCSLARQSVDERTERMLGAKCEHMAPGLVSAIHWPCAIHGLATEATGEASSSKPNGYPEWTFCQG